MKEKIVENKEKIVNMLNKQVENGIKIAEKLEIDSNVYGIITTNLLNAYKNAEQMGAEIEFEKEQERLKKEYQKKNN